MSNTTLTADIIAKEAVMILENELVMSKLVHRGYEDEYSNKVNGYEPGETVSIRRPADFTVRSGEVAAAQDVVEGKTSITVDQVRGVDFKFTGTDLTLKIGELAERVLKPAVVQIANAVELSVMGLYYAVPNHVTIPSGGIDSFADFALAGTRADLTGMPMDGRAAVLNPTDYNALVGSQTALYIEKVATEAYRKGRIGTINDFDTYKSNNLPTHTAGTRTGTDLIDLPIIDGTHTWANLKNATTVTIHMDGFAASTSTVAAGDTFTVSDVYDVNPVTKATLPHLKMFTVMTAFTASGSEGDIVIWPPMILSGSQKTCHLASGTDIDDNTVTWQGVASTAYRQNLFFHKNAFALAMVPMTKPPGAIEVGRQSYKGFSIRIIPYYDGLNNVSNWRMDVLYGVKCIDPRLAVRASLAADI